MAVPIGQYAWPLENLHDELMHHNGMVRSCKEKTKDTSEYQISSSSLFKHDISNNKHVY